MKRARLTSGVTDMLASKRLAALGLALLFSSPSARAQEVQFYHLDAIGNVRAVTDASGNVVERHDYLPFGEECTTGSCASNPGIAGGQPKHFTGKERDTETGLDYFGARYYRGGLGRFTTVDPAMNASLGLYDPQRWNRYAYGRNNPFRYVDPDGRDISETLKEWYQRFQAWRAGLAKQQTEVERQWLAANHIRLKDRTTGRPVELAGLSDEQVHEIYLRAHTSDPNGTWAIGATDFGRDKTGKVHNDIPDSVPDSWTREDLEHAAQELRESINTRREELRRLGEEGGHRDRIRQEEGFLRQIEKKLSGS